MERIAAGVDAMAASDRDQWCWRAMITQLQPIDGAMIDRAIEEARSGVGRSASRSEHDHCDADEADR